MGHSLAPRTIQSRKAQVLLLVGMTTMVSADGFRCTSSSNDRSVKQPVVLPLVTKDTSDEEPSTSTSWERFQSPDGDFSVELPGTPTPFNDTVSTPIGNQAVVRYKMTSEGCEYDSGYLQRSAHILAKLVGEESILKSACDGTAAHLRGRVTRSTSISIDHCAAREVEIELKDDPLHRATARLIITNDRIYHAIVITPVLGSEHQAASGRRFLDSLHVIDRDTVTAAR